MNKAAAATASQHGLRLLTSDEIADVTGGVIVCYGLPVRPHPGPHDGAPYLPPSHRLP
jgi:hypothetical protein